MHLRERFFKGVTELCPRTDRHHYNIPANISAAWAVYREWFVYVCRFFGLFFGPGPF